MTIDKDIPFRLRAFVVLFTLGLVGSIVDGVAYLLYIHKSGIRVFAVVPWEVLWGYVSTLPGILLTALWLVPWMAAMLALWLPWSGKRTGRETYRRKAEQ